MDKTKPMVGKNERTCPKCKKDTLIDQMTPKRTYKTICANRDCRKEFVRKEK